MFKYITVVCHNQYRPGLSLLVPSSDLPLSKARDKDIMIIMVVIIVAINFLIIITIVKSPISEQKITDFI